MTEAATRKDLIWINDEGDIDYDGECAALFDRRKSVSDRAVNSMWLDEWGIGTDDDELSGPAPSRTLRRTWSEEVDALEAVDTAPPHEEEIC